MDNARERYTDKEIANFKEWWNDGVSTEEMAKRLRRTKASIAVQAANLRNKGHYLIDRLARLEAIRLYKATQQRRQDIETLERSLAEDASDEVVTPNEQASQSETPSVDPQVETFIEMWNTGVPIQAIAEELGEPAAALLRLPHTLRKEGFTLISATERLAIMRPVVAAKEKAAEADTPTALTITTIVSRGGLELSRTTTVVREGLR